MSYRKLDKDVKDTWIQALQSGDYRQGRKQLGKRTGTPRSDSYAEVEYCCLGVLAVTTPDKSQPYWRDNNLAVPDQDPHGYFDEVSQIPSYLEDLYNLDPEAQDVLTTMNDSGASFSDIAEWIEINL